MKIHSISYERSKEDGRNRQTAKMEVLITQDEDPDIVLDWMTARIHNDLGIDSEELLNELKRLGERRRELEAKIQDLETQATKAAEHLQKIKAFFAKQNIPLPSSYDDIPF